MTTVSDIDSKPASSGWHLALKEATGERFLGDRDVVGALARHFIAGICDRYAAVCEGRAVPWEAAQADRDECKGMAALFSGKDASCTPMKRWNTSGDLGRHVAEQLEGIVAPAGLADPQSALEQCFALVAHQVYGILGDANDEASINAAQAWFASIADELTKAMLGFPSQISPAAPAPKRSNSMHGKPASPGGQAKHKPAPPGAVTHPQLGDDGKPFLIYSPSKASALSTWSDPSATAVCVPGGAMPAVLNGVPLAPWGDYPRTIEGWEYVDGQMEDLDEPDMITNGKAPAAGVIIEEPDGRIWLVNPSNGFAGYTTTFPKGHADAGISLQATAIKETFEESGLQVEITGLHGDVERGRTMTRYYRARRVGGTPAAMGWETQAVQLVPQSGVHAAVNRDVDRKVAALAGIKAPAA